MEDQNQENSLEQKEVNKQNGSESTLTSRPNIIKVLFSLVIVFFFFNFLTISCGGKEVVSATGVEFVINHNKTNDILKHDGKTENIIPLNTWVIIALACAFIGLGIFLMDRKNKASIGLYAGIIGFVALIVFQLMIRNAIGSGSKDTVLVEFGLAYWGALIAIGAASFLSFLEMMNVKNNSSNPKIQDSENISPTNP